MGVWRGSIALSTSAVIISLGYLSVIKGSWSRGGNWMGFDSTSDALLRVNLPHLLNVHPHALDLAR